MMALFVHDFTGSAPAPARIAFPAEQYLVFACYAARRDDTPTWSSLSEFPMDITDACVAVRDDAGLIPEIGLDTFKVIHLSDSGNWADVTEDVLRRCAEQIEAECDGPRHFAAAFGRWLEWASYPMQQACGVTV
jgi:hypothetical protein